MSTAEVLKRWLEAINAHDVGALAALMAPEFLFVDSTGNPVRGAAKMERGWQAYFSMCPDYWVRADHVMAEGATALVAGEAGGTIDGQAWRTPAAWKAVIRDGTLPSGTLPNATLPNATLPNATLEEWRVFADNKPVYEILAKRGP